LKGLGADDADAVLADAAVLAVADAADTVAVSYH
jgi:hypothetical protein